MLCTGYNYLGSLNLDERFDQSSREVYLLCPYLVYVNSEGTMCVSQVLLLLCCWCLGTAVYTSVFAIVDGLTYGRDENSVLITLMALLGNCFQFVLLIVRQFSQHSVYIDPLGGYVIYMYSHFRVVLNYASRPSRYRRSSKATKETLFSTRCFIRRHTIKKRQFSQHGVSIDPLGVW